MWMYQQVNIVIFSSVLIIFLSAMKLEQHMYEHLLSYHQISTSFNIEGAYIQRISGMSCAALCLQMSDCILFCLKADECFLAQSKREHSIQTNSHNSVKGLMSYDCFINEKTNSEASDAIVQAFGVSNVALRKPIIASSYYNENGIICDAALTVDGKMDRRYNSKQISCVITNLEPTPWLLIDLEANYLVLFVNITNNDNSDALGGNYFIFNSLCFDYNKRVGDDFWFGQCYPDAIPGQYVSLQIPRFCRGNPKCLDEPGNSINFSEVQVFALLMNQTD